MKKATNGALARVLAELCPCRWGRCGRERVAEEEGGFHGASAGERVGQSP
jgi:hypothetical protein